MSPEENLLKESETTLISELYYVGKNIDNRYKVIENKRRFFAIGLAGIADGRYEQFDYVEYIFILYHRKHDVIPLSWNNESIQNYIRDNVLDSKMSFYSFYHIVSNFLVPLHQWSRNEMSLYLNLFDENNNLIEGKELRLFHAILLLVFPFKVWINKLEKKIKIVKGHELIESNTLLKICKLMIRFREDKTFTMEDCLNACRWEYIREKIKLNTRNEASISKMSISNSMTPVIPKTTSMSHEEKQARPRCKLCKSIKCDGTWETYSQSLPKKTGKNEKVRLRKKFMEKHK